MTPRDIINLALKNSGVLAMGQNAPAEMTNDAFLMLNAMIGQWAQKRWLIYHLVNVSKVCTGVTSYTVGPGGDFAFAIRPANIAAAFVSQNTGTAQQIDTVLDSREDYNRIAMKSLVSFPYFLYYDNAFPLGVAYPWPAPNAGLYSLTLTAKAVLPAFTSLSADIALPAEYQEALFYNLAARLRPYFQMTPDASIIALARAALNTVRNANTQIPRLEMPHGVPRGGRYNVYSDQSR
jgi:hypothetical protein